MRNVRPTMFQSKYFSSKLSSDGMIFFYANNGAPLRPDPIMFLFILPLNLYYVWHFGESCRVNPEEIPTEICWESVYLQNYTTQFFPLKRNLKHTKLQWTHCNVKYIIEFLSFQWGVVEDSVFFFWGYDAALLLDEFFQTFRQTVLPSSSGWIPQHIIRRGILAGHEEVRGSGVRSPLILDVNTRSDVSGSSRFTFGTRWVGSVHFGKKNLLLLTAIEPRFLGRPSHNPVPIPTELYSCKWSGIKCSKMGRVMSICISFIFYSPFLKCRAGIAQVV